MTNTERIELITECLGEIHLDEMTRYELMQKLRNLSINDIEDFIWDMYCVINDICYTLNL
jgi:hypothetical protein